VFLNQVLKLALDKFASISTKQFFQSSFVSMGLIILSSEAK
jgi:hypothetical protein